MVNNRGGRKRSVIVKGEGFIASHFLRGEEVVHRIALQGLGPSLSALAKPLESKYVKKGLVSKITRVL